MRSVCARCGDPMSVKAGTVERNEQGESERVCDDCYDEQAEVTEAYP